MAAKKKYPKGAKRISMWMPTEMDDALTKRAADLGVYKADVVHAALRKTLGLPEIDKPKDQSFG